MDSARAHPDSLTAFLVDEYAELWRETGVEPLALPAARLVRALAGTGETERAASSSPETPPADLAALRRAIGDCQRCPLCESRHQLVFGGGNPRARLAFVGDAPGPEEDQTGLPFVSAAGQLLTRIIEAMGYTRDAVYLTTTVKCRAPGLRSPTEEERARCSPFLERQLELVGARIVVALGPEASALLTGSDRPLSELRGRLVRRGRYEVMPTYHPSYLLQTPSAKRAVWEDMKLVKARLETFG